MALPAVLQHLALPVVASPMFIVSYPELVLAQCKAGIVGSFPALNARPAELLDEWLTQIQASLAEHKAANPDAVIGPIAVNQIVHQSNARLEQDVRVCVEHKVPIFITSLRAPAREIVDAVHSYGGIVLHDVINIRHAQKALEAGVDGLILVAAGAGGHAGTTSPVRARRRSAAHLRRADRAVGRRLPTAARSSPRRRWARTSRTWARASSRRARRTRTRATRHAIVDSNAADIIYTNLFTGVHGNYIRQSIVKAGLDPDALPESDKTAMNFGDGSSKAKAWKDIWGAGQGVGLMHDVPSVGELVARLKQEYEEAKARIGVA